MNYIVTKNKSYFQKIGTYNYCFIDELDLPDIIAFDSETTGNIKKTLGYSNVS